MEPGRGGIAQICALIGLPGAESSRNRDCTSRVGCATDGVVTEDAETPVGNATLGEGCATDGVVIPLGAATGSDKWRAVTESDALRLRSAALIGQGQNPMEKRLLVEVGCATDGVVIPLEPRRDRCVEEPVTEQHRKLES